MKPDPSYTRDLIQYRMERARQTLDTARLLRESADIASMVNRSYYAMFYAALALLATIGKETSKHSGALALFDKHFIKTGLTKINPRFHGQWRNKFWNSPKPLCQPLK